MYIQNFEFSNEGAGSKTFKLEVRMNMPSGEYTVLVKGERSRITVSLTEHQSNASDALISIIYTLSYIIDEMVKMFKGKTYVNHKPVSGEGHGFLAEITMNHFKYKCSYGINNPANGGEIAVMKTEIVPIDNMEHLKLQAAMCFYTKNILVEMYKLTGANFQ